MTTRKRALTAQIKPATRNAIMDQLALAASEIEMLRGRAQWFEDEAVGVLWRPTINFAGSLQKPYSWWRRLMRWRK